MKRRRRTYRPARRRAVRVAVDAAAKPRGRTYAAAATAPVLNRGLLRVVVCGVVFVVLIALKLLLPGKMAGVRDKVGAWLVRDADFTSAFSAVGHAVSGESGALDAIEDAYIAVFGGEKRTREVSGAAEVLDGEAAEITDGEVGKSEVEKVAADKAAAEGGTLPPQPWPERTDARQHVLGFDYAAPLDGVTTSSFGWRESPATGREAFHYGIDLAAEEGAEIDCFADGMVGVVAESVELGKYLTVHHENGVMTLYAHCSRITVPSGAAVRRGDKLAEVGSTGNATGPHLHFEVHDGEVYLDPVYYLS